MAVKKLFEIAVGEDENTGVYFAIVSSVTDQKHATVSDASIKRLLPKVNKLIRGKAKQERLLPMPTKSKVSPFSNGAHVVASIPLARARN